MEADIKSIKAFFKDKVGINTELTNKLIFAMYRTILQITQPVIIMAPANISTSHLTFHGQGNNY